MKLSCQSCGIELHPRDVDFDALRARCRRCGWRFGGPVSIGPYRRQGTAIVDGPPRPVRSPDERSPAPVAAPAPPLEPTSDAAALQGAMPLPANVTLHDRDGILQIEVRRRSLAALGLGLAAALGWSIYVGLLLLEHWLPPWGALLLLVSAVFAYVGAAVGLNRTTVLLGGERLFIRHEPLPWPTRSAAASTITQLYVSVTGGPREPGRYELRAVTARGDLPLVTGLSQPQPALYLEQAIEQRLGIPDRAVTGEYAER